MGFLRAELTAACRGGVLAGVDRRRRGGPDAHRGDERPDLPTARERARRPPTARAASAALPPQPSTCTSRTPELVFARPAAGWRRDRPGGGRALRSGQPGSRAPAVEEPPVVTAYEPHRRYAVSPTELSPERWSGRTRSSRTARARFRPSPTRSRDPSAGSAGSSSSGSSARTTGAPTSAAASRTLAALKAPAKAQHRDGLGR
jgi:hypothetical protein